MSSVSAPRSSSGIRTVSTLIPSAAIDLIIVEAFRSVSAPSLMSTILAVSGLENKRLAYSKAEATSVALLSGC